MWAILLTLSALTSSTSCRASSEALERANPEEQTILLDVAVFDAMGVRQLIRQWERAHPGVTVELQSGSWIAQNEDLLDGFDSYAPDIVTVEGAYTYRAFSQPDQFVDLRAYGADELRQDFVTWRWDQGVHERSGRVLGIPTDLGGLAIAYRVDLFAQAGLPTEPDEVAALWPDWESYLETGNRFQEVSTVSWIDHASWLFSGLVSQHPRQFSHTIEGGRFIPGEGLQRAWDIATDATGLSANVTIMSPGAFSPASPSPQFATTIAPAWLTTHIKGTAPEVEDLWAIAPVPGRNGNWGGSQLAIPMGAEHPELAWDLISFLSTASSQLEILEKHGNFPSRSDIYAIDDVSNMTDPFFNDAPVFEIYSEAIAATQGATSTAYDRPIQVAFDSALNRLLSGELNELQAWRHAIRLVEQSIAEAEQ